MSEALPPSHDSYYRVEIRPSKAVEPLVQTSQPVPILPEEVEAGQEVQEPTQDKKPQTLWIWI